MNDEIFDNRGFSVWRSAKAVGATLVILIALIPAFDVGGRVGGWAFGLVLVAAAFWWRWRRRADLLAGMPTTAIRALVGGYVEVTGKVERADARELRDPIQDGHCCWFGVETLHWRTGRVEMWLPIKRAASSRQFVLRDATGSCLVDLRGAQVALDSPVDIGVNKRVKHRIWRIEEGDTITVLGEANRLNGRWRIGRPATRKFFATHGTPEHAERSLRDEARGHWSPLIVFAIIAAVVLGAAALLSGCARPSDSEGAAASRRHDAADIDGLTASYEAQLAETDRAERWREEQQRWAEQKLAISAESVADVERSEAPAPELAGAKVRYQNLILAVAELRRRGAIGVDGEVPTWLRVTSIGPSIDVRNSSDERLVVKSWRVFSHQSGSRLCEMIAHDARSSSIENPDLAPGQKLNYRNDTRRPCYEGSDENLLAFEIHRGNELVWVTRSRLPELLGVRASEVDALLDSAASMR